MRLPEVLFCLFGPTSQLCSLLYCHSSQCLMGKMAICSDSLSNLTCQSIWLWKTSADFSSPNRVLCLWQDWSSDNSQTHKILPEKQVVGSISFTGDSPSTGIFLIKTSLIPEFFYLFINRAFVIIILFPGIAIENDDATTYMLIYLIISYIF